MTDNKVLVQICLETPHRGLGETNTFLMKKFMVDIIQEYLYTYNDETMYHYNDDDRVKLGDHEIKIFETANEINAYKTLESAGFDFNDYGLLDRIIDNMCERAFPKKHYFASGNRKKDDKLIMKCVKKLKWNERDDEEDEED